MVRVWDEVCHHTEHTVREELLVCGYSWFNLILQDSDIDVKLQAKKKRCSD